MTTIFDNIDEQLGKRLVSTFEVSNSVPAPLVGEEIVKFGYVPVTVVAPEPVRLTT